MILNGKEMQSAAAQNEHDDYGARHNRLASIVHRRIERGQQVILCRITVNYDTVMSSLYQSRFAAEAAARTIVDKAYNEANAYFLPDKTQCIAEELAAEYAKHIQQGTCGFVNALAPYCQNDAVRKEQLSALNERIVSCEKQMLEQFEWELKRDSEYYRMYKKSYFWDLVSIEKCGQDVELAENNIWNGIARLLQCDVEYSVEGLFEVVSELEEDVRKHAESFFAVAHQRYLDYCAEIENIAEEIGKNLSDDALVQMGIL